ncbi:MAG: hypothetical protein LQ343_005317 [Gyalolechia ehrenbergii]|nr:MAG: hypothetical protein LQ343_005317 [Gyalolechia ehrenbergii]
MPQEEKKPESSPASKSMGKESKLQPKEPKLSTVREETSELVSDIFAQRGRMIFLWDRFGDVIRKRWHKKTPDQRKKFLHAAWPLMADHHRPDINGWHVYSKEELQTSCKDFFIFPHINSDDLSRPGPLLVLMQNRARYSPDTFVTADMESLSFGITSGVLTPPYLTGWTTLMLGRKTGKTYGQMRSWANDEEAHDLAACGVGLHTGEAMLVLELQDRLFGFLIRCTEMILLDLDHKTPHNLDLAATLASMESWPMSPIPSDPLEALTEAPYRAPADFNLERMQALLFAKHMEVLEHLWYCREDPGYFHDQVLEYAQHQNEQLLDTKGQPHPGLYTPQFWKRIMTNVVSNAYGDPHPWRLAMERVAVVSQLHEKYKDRISPGKKLPHEFDVAVCKLNYHLNQTVSHAASMLTMGLSTSPPLRKYFRRDPEDDSTSPVRRIKREIMILWLLQQLQDERQIQFFGLHNLLSYIHRIMLSQLKGREIVSPFVAKILSELALITEIFRQFYIFRVKAPEKPAMKHQALYTDYKSKMLVIDKVCDVFDENDDVFAIDDPTQMFHYPFDKEDHDEEAVSLARLAEAHLDTLSSKLDRLVRYKTQKGLLMSLAPELLNRTRKRTGKWEDVKDRKVADPAYAEAAAVQFNKMSLEDQASSSKAPMPPPPPTPPAPPLPGTIPFPELQLPTIKVGKKAFKTFSTLYADSTNRVSLSTNRVPLSTIQWPDFVNAMVNAGFKVEKLCGSAWMFFPKADKDVGKAVILHEPHPGVEMPLDMVRRYGETLGRVYGWTGQTFVRGG